MNWFIVVLIFLCFLFAYGIHVEGWHMLHRIALVP